MKRIDLIAVLIILVAALAVRLFFASRLVFPPLDDPAFYIQTARNLAAGRGLVSDVIWNYFVPLAAVTHPSHEFWMPLATLSMAGTIKLLGDTWPSAQWPGLISGVILPVLTYALGRSIWPAQRRWALLAAGLVIPSTVIVYQSGSGDSAALYTLLSAGALMSAAKVMRQPTKRWAMLTGLWCGLSYLTRSHGSLLLIAISLVWLIDLRHDLRCAFTLLGALAVGAGIVIGPWWLRNLAVFGLIQPFPLASAFAARDYGEWFNYLDLPALAKLGAEGLVPMLLLRGQALWHDLGVMLLITFPFGVIGLPAALFRREAAFRLFSTFAILLWLIVSVFFPVPALTGSFYHSAGTLVPLAALGSVVVIKSLAAQRRWRLLSAGVYGVAGLLVIGQAVLAWPVVWADSQANKVKFEEATQWLRLNAPPDQPIITNEAHSLNYASGYPTLTLPNQQDVVMLRALADRYQVDLVVVVGSIGRYPDALDQPEARAKLLAALSGIRIYQLTP